MSNRAEIEATTAWQRFIAKQHAIQDVRDKYRPKVAALTEQMQAEIDAIEREYNFPTKKAA